MAERVKNRRVREVTRGISYLIFHRKSPDKSPSISVQIKQYRWSAGTPRDMQKTKAGIERLDLKMTPREGSTF